MTPIEQYYRQELDWLFHASEEFAEAHPDLARHLHPHGNDPDVERLLEGFAFLTARVRQRLDDDLPELTHTLLNVLFPHYLRPLPAATIVELRPKLSVTGPQRIERHTPLGSVVKEGTRCIFRTCFAVDLLPLRIERLMLERSGERAGRLILTFAAMGRPELRPRDVHTIRLYLAGEDQTARTLLMVLLRNVEALELACREPRGGKETTLLLDPQRVIRPVAFDLEGSSGDPPANLQPNPPVSFAGYQLLQEYFFYPAKFHFVDLCLSEVAARLGPSADRGLERIELRFLLRDLPSDLGTVDEQRIRLHCTPALNLFPHDAEPIVVDHERSEYEVRPHAGRPEHYEVHSVERLWRVEPDRRELPCLNAFDYPGGTGSGAVVCYEPVLRPGIDERTTQTFVRFVLNSGAPITEANAGELAELLPPPQTLSVELLCTNRDLPAQLGPGEISVPVHGSPECATFENIGSITRTVSPPLDDGLHWKLISHLSLNYLAISGVDALRGLLGLYDFQAGRDEQARRRSRRRLEGLIDLTSQVEDDLYGGALVRVVHTSLTIDEEKFAGAGDVFLFASVLEGFLAMYIAANAFSRLTVRLAGSGGLIEFPARAGTETLL